MKNLNRRRFVGTLAVLGFFPKALSAASIAKPASGQGMIIVHRPCRAVGSVLLFSTTVNGTSIGNLTNGRVLAQQVAPGNYTVETVSASVGGVATASVSAGETVFVRAEARMGYPAGRPTLAVVSPQQGQSEVSAL